MKTVSRHYQPRRTRAQWAVLVDQQTRSKLSAKQFCEREALSYGSFIKWRSQLNGPTAAQSSGEFIELTAETIQSAVAAPRTEPCCIELQIGTAVTLRIYAD